MHQKLVNSVVCAI